MSFATQLAYARTSEYVVVPAGTYDFEVTLADTGQSALTAPGIVLEGNTTYDLVLMGEPNDSDHPLEIRPLMTTTSERVEGTPGA